MARHNRQGEGVDQAGFTYSVSYPPDWLRQVRIGRTLPSGRRSTQTLFRNPLEQREAPPGEQRRIHIQCPEQSVDLVVTIQCDPVSCQRLVVEYQVGRNLDREEDLLVFVIEGGLG